jgi:hypothetical protein
MKSGSVDALKIAGEHIPGRRVFDEVFAERAAQSCDRDTHRRFGIRRWLVSPERLLEHTERHRLGMRGDKMSDQHRLLPSKPRPAVRTPNLDRTEHAPSHACPPFPLSAETVGDTTVWHEVVRKLRSLEGVQRATQHGLALHASSPNLG